jgi:phage tail-like protein
MATTVADIKAQYPIPVWKYQVTVDGDDYFFSEISGITQTNETITYRDGKNTMYMPGMDTPVELSLKKGIIKGDSKLTDWIFNTKMNTIDKRDITISLLDQEDLATQLVTWTVTNAFPKKLDAPSFNATSNEIAIESLDLMADSLAIEFK